MTVFIQCQIHKIVIFRSVNKRKHTIGRELRKSVPLVVGLRELLGYVLERRRKNYPEGEFCCSCYFLLRLRFEVSRPWKHQSFGSVSPSLLSCCWKLNGTVSSTYGQSTQLNMKRDCTSPLHSFVQISTSWRFHGLRFLQTNRLRSILVFCQLQTRKCQFKMTDNTSMWQSQLI